MSHTQRSILYAILAVAAASSAAFAQPLAGALLPMPPGTVVQSQDAYLSGKIPDAQWRAVASKKLVGASNGTEFYQWYLSIYALRRDAFRLRYQSPGNGGPLARVTQAHGATMWFPVQELRIVGAADLIGGSVEQIVVASHEMAADCGSSRVTVFGSGPAGSVVPLAVATNFCDLGATIARGRSQILLQGPYYGPKAPLCCPTKPKVTAVLQYKAGKWIETPKYFKLYLGHFPTE